MCAHASRSPTASSVSARSSSMSGCVGAEAQPPFRARVGARGSAVVATPRARRGASTARRPSRRSPPRRRSSGARGRSRRRGEVDGVVKIVVVDPLSRLSALSATSLPRFLSARNLTCVIVDVSVISGVSSSDSYSELSSVSESSRPAWALEAGAGYPDGAMVRRSRHHVVVEDGPKPSPRPPAPRRA